MKRFWQAVTVEPRDDGHVVLLDGKPVRTPKRRELLLPSAALAAAVAAEWREQGETVDVPAMRVTRLATTRLDLFPEREADAREEVLGYVGTDLLCFRASEPADLARRQADGWDPWLDWAWRALDVRLLPVDGVIAGPVPPDAETTVRHHLDRLDPWRLVAVHAGTIVTGSFVLGFALEAGAIDAETAFAVGQLDELYEIERWGMTDMARERHAKLRADLAAIDRYAGALREGHPAGEGSP